MGPDVTAELEDQVLPSSFEPAVARLGLQSRILEEVDTAVIAVDLAGTIIFANKFASTLYGWETSELVGTTAADLMILAISRDIEEEIAAAISQGGSWEGTFEVRRKDGSNISVRAVDSPLYDAAGELIGIVSAGTDATRERASELLMLQTARAAQVSQFLADCGTALASALDYEEAIEQLGRSCVPFLADLCLIDVGEGEWVRRMVAAHHVPEQQDLIDELEHYGPDPNGVHPAVRALRSGSDALSDSMSDSFLRATTRDDRHYAIVKELNFQSYICVLWWPGGTSSARSPWSRVMPSAGSASGTSNWRAKWRGGPPCCWTMPGCCRSPPMWPGCSRPRGCRRHCRSSPAWRRPPATSPSGPAWRWAATSTTSSVPAAAPGSLPWATCVGAGPRQR